MTHAVPEEILGKIRKCLALSKSNFEAEADTAMKMAEKLMAAHGVSMAEIDMDDDGHIKADHIKEVSTKAKDMWPWEKDLARVPANLMAVSYFFHVSYKKKSITYVGTESDASLASEIYSMLRKELLKISKVEPDELGRRSFLTGCVHTLRDRSWQIKRERERSAKEAVATKTKTKSMTGTELMVVKSNQLEKFMKENYAHLSAMHSRGSAVSDSSYNNGRAAGHNINLSFNKAIK